MTTAAEKRGPDVSLDRALLERCTRSVTRAAATFAGFCEHVEHNEANSIADVLDAAKTLRTVAGELASEIGISLYEAYASRIEMVERSSIHRHVAGAANTSLGGFDALQASSTWEQVQVAQVVHDRQFHPDVFGLSKFDQMRHYTLHVTKLAGFMVDAVEFDDLPSFAGERLADLAIFGVKVATVCNERLPATSVVA